jgi:hypothetical protein
VKLTIYLINSLLLRESNFEIIRWNKNIFNFQVYFHLSCSIWIQNHRRVKKFFKGGLKIFKFGRSATYKRSLNTNITESGGWKAAPPPQQLTFYQRKMLYLFGSWLKKSHWLQEGTFEVRRWNLNHFTPEYIARHVLLYVCQI